MTFNLRKFLQDLSRFRDKSRKFCDFSVLRGAGDRAKKETGLGG
ncbi:hypothetical protein SLEP1_g1504 [Rubroshorea leprosula]|uniref:Uncharacterized protein n=1 Tax=Rubroshorea leprosula TaxID=152421 RepID=A0AAV5HMA2_9ROSI|nr:hypothetical protein SLEP1_g1504 [Rubroshorea leprosula]